MRGLWRPGVSPYRMYAPQRARVRDRCRFGALGRCARAVHTACGTAPLVSPHAGTRRTARRTTAGQPRSRESRAQRARLVARLYRGCLERMDAGFEPFVLHAVRTIIIESIIMREPGRYAPPRPSALGLGARGLTCERRATCNVPGVVQP